MTVAVAREQAARKARNDFMWAQRAERYGVLIPFAVVAVLAVLLVPNFLTGPNLRNVLVNAALAGLVGLGATLVVTMRHLDLSVGSGIAVSAATAALVVPTWGTAPGVLAGLAAGAVAGAVNGVLVAHVRIPSFVATLATLGIFRGMALLLTGGGTLRVESDLLSWLATGRIAGVPVPAVIAVVGAVCARTLLERTPYGRAVAAVGGRPEAAVEAGINVRAVTLTTFVVAGLFVGVAGLLYLGQLSQVSGNLGSGFELNVIAITVLGGTSLSGGSGNVVGTMVAAVLLATIGSSLNLLSLPDYYQYAAIGALLLFALGLDSVRRAAQRRALLEA